MCNLAIKEKVVVNIIEVVKVSVGAVVLYGFLFGATFCLFSF